MSMTIEVGPVGFRRAEAEPKAHARWAKRTMDVALASVLLLVVAPVCLLLAILIKFDSSGPVFFRQTRHGLNGRTFNILKFRTMKVLENGGSVRQVSREDSRVTTVGGWLRRTSIDELPQLLNVLRGEMSLVGPRPHAAAHNHHYGKLITGYMRRHDVKPGMTGWAQVNGARGETPTVDCMRRRVELDLWYVANATILVDLLVLIRTPFTLFSKHIY